MKYYWINEDKTITEISYNEMFTKQTDNSLWYGRTQTYTDEDYMIGAAGYIEPNDFNNLITEVKEKI